MSLTQQTFDKGAQDSRTEGTLKQTTSPASGDAAALEAALIENRARPKLNLVEEARAYAKLIEELGLTHEQMGKRVGRDRVTVTYLVRILTLSEETLGFLERGELGMRHVRALLKVKDPEVRGALARAAVQEGWSVVEFEARVHGAANKQEQDFDATNLTVAKAWGEALGVEVGVYREARGQVAVKLKFISPEEALALADRLTAALSC
jgi:ParB family chromosome partitioning protein